ncbi:zinc ribbon domain-containing protein [Bacteroidales bacterium]|nr:zinc ribbon domain-containing protein [Bacteroidales bacterium]
MYCKNCGKQIDDDSKYCNYCGTQQSLNSIKNSHSEARKVDVNLKIQGPKIRFPHSQSEKKLSRIDRYDESYKKETNATLVGIIVLIANFGILVTDNEIDDETYAILIVLALILRIVFTVWIVNIAKRQNRPSSNWGVLGFLFPSISLIIIGQLKKIKDLSKKPTKVDKPNSDSNNRNDSYHVKDSEFEDLKKSLKSDETIIMQKEDEIYSKIKKEEWEKAKAKGADQEFEEIGI